MEGWADIGWMDVWTDERMGGCVEGKQVEGMDEGVDGKVNGRVVGCLDGRMGGRMDGMFGWKGGKRN